MQPVLDNLWEHLLPGFAAGTVGGEAQQDLDERLRGLRLPPCVARPSPDDWQDWTAAPFSVAPAAEGLAAVPLTSVRLTRAGHGLDVSITEPANALSFPVGATDWLVSTPCDTFDQPIPVAASGGWLNEHSLRVEVIFLESPHRMDIACSLPTRVAEATWRQAPLTDGTLQTLHRPR
jgi:hypothetical protein